MGGGAFSNDYHLQTQGEERHDGKKDWEAVYKNELRGLVCYLKGTDRYLILRAKSIGAWMSVRGTAVSGTVLSATVFRYFLCTCYNVSPLNPHRHSNGCGKPFEVTHTLSCSTGCLVIACHNEIRDELLYLSQRAFTSASVCAKPLIHLSRTRSKQDIHQGSDKYK